MKAHPKNDQRPNCAIKLEEGPRWGEDTTFPAGWAELSARLGMKIAFR